MTLSSARAATSATDSPEGAPQVESCVSCGSPAGTRYCPHCGERRALDREYSLAHFAREGAEAFTNTEGKLLRTLWTLLKRPGELTAAYMRGERVGYMRPLQLFLLVNVAYFALTTWTGARVFDTPLRIHMSATAHKEIATRLVRARIAARGITADQYQATFDSVSRTHAKSLIIVMVPAFGVFVAVIAATRRRYALQHLVFSLHAFSALMIILVTVGAAVEFPFSAWVRWRGEMPSWQVFDQIATSAILVTFGTYVALALRRVYEDGRAGAVAKAAILCVALGVVLFAYRFVLFFTTFWAT
jgi:hypothetical protein